MSIRRLRAPTVRSGQRLTPGVFNELSRAVNQGLNAPRDLDGGVTQAEADSPPSSMTLQEIGRTTEAVRVFNPDDEEQYVDVDRIVTLTVIDSRTGISSTTIFNS